MTIKQYKASRGQKIELPKNSRGEIMSNEDYARYLQRTEARKRFQQATQNAIRAAYEAYDPNGII